MAPMKPPVVVAERAVMRPAPTLTRAAEPIPPKAVPTRVAQSALGGLHLVKPGETLTSIAQDYGTTRPKLAAANAIDEWTNVRIGQKLKVPGGEPARQQAQVDLQAKPLGHLPAKVQLVAKAEPAKAVKTVSIKPAEPKQAEAIAAAPVAKVVVGAKPVVVAKVDKPKAEQIRTITAKAAPQAREDDDAEETASLPAKPAGKEQQGDQVASTAPASDAPQFRWPVKGRIIQAFGQSSDGINISVPEGTEVKAAEGGVVAYAGSELKGYGNLILIRHANGFVTAYAHAKDLDVKRGDTVKRGQTIATAGQTGNVTSPQLLFELRKGATPVDPRQYLVGDLSVGRSTQRPAEPPGQVLHILPGGAAGARPARRRPFERLGPRPVADPAPGRNGRHSRRPCRDSRPGCSGESRATGRTDPTAIPFPRPPRRD